MRTTRTKKILDLRSLVLLREAYRNAGQTVVWTNGCFDLLHAGHIRSLQAASQLGDILVVGLNHDDSVRQLKGQGRPILPAQERAEILAALECVDHVLIFADLIPIPSLQAIRPDIHCKGADYAPPHGKALPERAVVEAYGGRIAFLPLLEGISTTDLVDRIQGGGKQQSANGPR
jgi:rfaE bifunctional protein nucleotidyltransferase chain/domain